MEPAGMNDGSERSALMYRRLANIVDILGKVTQVGAGGLEAKHVAWRKEVGRNAQALNDQLQDTNDELECEVLAFINDDIDGGCLKLYMRGKILVAKTKAAWELNVRELIAKHSGPPEIQ